MEMLLHQVGVTEVNVMDLSRLSNRELLVSWLVVTICCNIIQSGNVILKTVSKVYRFSLDC